MHSAKPNETAQVALNQVRSLVNVLNECMFPGSSQESCGINSQVNDLAGRQHAKIARADEVLGLMEEPLKQIKEQLIEPGLTDSIQQYVHWIRVAMPPPFPVQRMTSALKQFLEIDPTVSTPDDFTQLVKTPKA